MTTTVGKLIEALQKFDPKLPIYTYDNIFEEGSDPFAIKEIKPGEEFPYCKSGSPNGDLPGRYLILFCGYDYTSDKYYRMGEVFDREEEFKREYGTKL